MQKEYQLFRGWVQERNNDGEKYVSRCIVRNETGAALVAVRKGRIVRCNPKYNDITYTLQIDRVH